MLRTLLVTTDFSIASRSAFGPAAALAKQFGARLHLVFVAGSQEIYTAWQLVNDSPACRAAKTHELEKRLAKLAQEEPLFQGIPVEPHVLAGDGPQVIEEFAAENHVDLLLIATHGGSGVRQFPLGSFTGKVLNSVTCPVLVCRATGPQSERAVFTFAPRRILAPHDFSKASENALDVARVWAEAFEAETRLLTVVEPSPALDGEPTIVEELVADDREAATAQVHQRLLRTAREKWRGLPVSACTRQGQVATGILREIEELRPDLVVMATRGLSLADRPTLAGVVERVIHCSLAPVLVVRSRKVVSASPPVMGAAQLMLQPVSELSGEGYSTSGRR